MSLPKAQVCLNHTGPVSYNTLNICNDYLYLRTRVQMRCLGFAALTLHRARRDFKPSPIRYNDNKHLEQCMDFLTENELPTPDTALPDVQTMPVPAEHFINGHPMTAPFPAVCRQQCSDWLFLGAERRFWNNRSICPAEAMLVTTPNPTTKKCVRA